MALADLNRSPAVANACSLRKRDMAHTAGVDVSLLFAITADRDSRLFLRDRKS